MAPLPAVAATLSLPLRNFAATAPATWAPMLERARDADAAGVDRLVVFDHVAFGERLEDYGRPELGGDAGATQPTGPDGHWLEPLTVLAVVAGMTQRVRLMTGILIAPLRSPAVLAKSAATLDVLSGGRLDLGVGVGWQEAEYVVNDLPFRDRGQLLDRALGVCRALWREDVASFDDGHLAFDRIHQMPKPLQAGGVPVWVSGRSTNPRVVERVVRFGTGWIPWGDDARDPGPGIARIREAMAAAGRTEQLQVTATLPVIRDDTGAVDVGRTLAGAAPLVALGATDLRANIDLAGDELRAFVAAFRTVVQ